MPRLFATFYLKIPFFLECFVTLVTWLELGLGNDVESFHIQRALFPLFLCLPFPCWLFPLGGKSKSSRKLNTFILILILKAQVLPKMNWPRHLLYKASVFLPMGSFRTNFQENEIISLNLFLLLWLSSYHIWFAIPLAQSWPRNMRTDRIGRFILWRRAAII